MRSCLSFLQHRLQIGLLGSLPSTLLLITVSAVLTCCSYWVNMKSMGITKPGQAPKTYSQSGIPVFLDCGSSIANLPTFLVNQILADFPGATYLPEPQIYQIDCSFATQDGTVNFGFGDIIFNVPYSEFIMQQSSNFCYLGTRINDEISSLGGVFSSSLYVS